VRIATGVIQGLAARFRSARRAVERCQALLYDTTSTLAEPNAVLRHDTNHMQGLLRPSLSQFVISRCPGYANRPFRATDGKGTSTLKIRSLVGCSPPLPWLLFVRHHSLSSVVGNPKPVYK
jgi:hypothetical protein